MTHQAVTVQIPDGIYKKIRLAAERNHRSVDEILVETISAAASSLDIPVGRFRSALAQMTYLNDAALWQAARATLLSTQKERLEFLHHKQQRESLSDEEQEEVQVLEQLYRDTVIVRAQAAVLLKQRNYDEPSR
jgi:hypothetical protein